MTDFDTFAKYPTTEEDVTADRLARVAAVHAQANWSRIFPTMHARGEVKGTPREADADTIHYLTMSNAVSEYTAAHLFRALIEYAPDKADEVAREVWGTWEDGGAVGEWVWEWLTEYGIDPERISDKAKP